MPGRNRNPRRRKAGTVKKLSPEAAAARDEGPRLIPLGATKDSGLARIEHYLALADRALGFSMPRAPGAPASTENAPQQEAPPEPPAKEVPASAPAPPIEEVLAKTRLIPPLPPKLTLPKPPRSPQPPKPPKLAAAKPPKPPAFPKPPKLSLPKPPRRNRRGG